ncbi:MAG: SRPBCC family protein [bacterium]
MSAPAAVSRLIAGSPAKVWEVLSDGWLYTGWVVGAAHIRDVESGWPAAGTRLHHSVGGWPFLVSDYTTSLEAVPEQRLRLKARAWPFGEAEVRVELEPEGSGTTVSMFEKPTAGPGKWLHNPLQQRVLVARNKEALARLDSLVTRRP